MTTCYVPGCKGEASVGGAYCRACGRLIRDDELKALRIAFHAPFYSGGGEAVEVMIRWEEEGLPCFNRVRDGRNVLLWLEYELALRAVAADICERRVKRLVRLGRRSEPPSTGGADDEEARDVR